MPITKRAPEQQSEYYSNSYRVTLNNCGDGGRTITAEYNTNNWAKARRLAMLAQAAFRDIRITNAETAQVYMNLYVDNEVFEKQTSVYIVLEQCDVEFED